jgi:predicted transcriptional regulator
MTFNRRAVGAHFGGGECRKGHDGDESCPASLPCGRIEQRYVGKQTSEKERVGHAFSGYRLYCMEQGSAMKLPLFTTKGVGVSDSTAGDLSSREAEALVSRAMQEPAVSIRGSITPDYLVCLEDGKKFKSLQMHLRKHGLTPETYRAKWVLPANYPMVAPNSSMKRSELAKQMQLEKKLLKRWWHPQKSGV